MGKEIEKKFKLSELPRGLSAGTKIRQGYLSVDDPEVRVRMKGENFFLTRKSGSGLTRDEEEFEISGEIFEILWSLTANRRIEKTRYEIAADNDLIWEIDEFQTGSNEKLFLAEVELPDESFPLQIPPIIAEVLLEEVTLDPDYKNKNLAVKNISNAG